MRTRRHFGSPGHIVFPSVIHRPNSAGISPEKSKAFRLNGLTVKPTELWWEGLLSAPIFSGYNRTDLIGHTISHFRITDKLGEGGMGVVYKAEDPKLERFVVLKLLAAHVVSDEDIRKSFEREAKAAARSRPSQHLPRLRD